MPTNGPRLAFTQQFDSTAPVLISKVGLSEAYSPDSGDPLPEIVEFRAIWDTGASGTLITPRVVAALNLDPIDEQNVQTANGERLSSVYLLNVYLPNKVAFPGVRVTDGNILGTDVLIGMDIINTGDFAVTNMEGKTCMSFQMPSSHRIDFVKEINSTRVRGASKRAKPKKKPKKRRR